MRKGIRFIASVLAGAIFMFHSGIQSYATEPITYLSEDNIEKKNADGTDKKPEQIHEELLKMAKDLPVETDELQGWPQGPKIHGEAAVVMDMDNGAILYGKNMDKKYYPASITKIMTALLAVENSEMTDKVTFTEESIGCLRPLYAHIAMQVGEEITMHDALEALMLASANEVAYAIGETIGGTHENFVRMMNERAKELGCEHTNFVNTNGIFDENHYVSAKDMALITKEAFSHPELLEVVQTLQYTIPETNLVKETRTFQQKHKMMVQGKFFDSRCFGGKTGYTKDSFNTLVTAMEENDKRLIIVILGSRETTVENTKELADYGFQNFQHIHLAQAGKIPGISGIPQEATVTVPKGITLNDLKFEAKKSGRLSYFYEGNLVGTTSANIEKPYKIEAVDAEKEEKEEKKALPVKPILVGGCVVVIIIASLLLVLLGIAKKKKKERMRRRRELQRRRRRMEEKKRLEKRIKQKDRIPEDEWY